LQASLLSKFSTLYSTNDDISLIKTFKFSQKIMLMILCQPTLSQCFYLRSLPVT
jgi:hypothetical protein